MRLSEGPRAVRRDDGFTLPELLLTIVIIGIISAALAGVVINYLKTSMSTESRLTESHDVQFAAAYWQRDVASTGLRIWDPATKTFPLQQSVNVTPTCALPAGAEVVTLAWSTYTSLDSTGAPVTVTVTYIAESDATGGYNLLRVRCTGADLDSQLEVMHSLDAVPTVTCVPGCAGAGDDTPAVVELHVSVLDPEGHSTTPTIAILSGERRQS